MKISCPICNYSFNTNDIDIDIVKSHTKCPNCREKIEINPQQETDHQVFESPKSIQIISEDVHLVIKLKLHKKKANIPSFLLLMFSGSLAFYCIIGLLSNKLELTIKPVALTALGLGLSYLSLALLLNDTLIIVSRGILSIRHVPVPLRKNKEINTDSIEQIYTMEESFEIKKNRLFYHSIYAISKDGSQQEIIKVNTREEAMYIENKLKGKIGIVGRPVSGEIQN